MGACFTRDEIPCSTILSACSSSRKEDYISEYKRRFCNADGGKYDKKKIQYDRYYNENEYSVRSVCRSNESVDLDRSQSSAISNQKAAKKRRKELILRTNSSKEFERNKSNASTGIGTKGAVFMRPPPLKDLEWTSTSVEQTPFEKANDHDKSISGLSFTTHKNSMTTRSPKQYAPLNSSESPAIDYQRLSYNMSSNKFSSEIGRAVTIGTNSVESSSCFVEGGFQMLMEMGMKNESSDYSLDSPQKMQANEIEEQEDEEEEENEEKDTINPIITEVKKKKKRRKNKKRNNNNKNNKKKKDDDLRSMSSDSNESDKLEYFTSYNS